MDAEGLRLAVDGMDELIGDVDYLRCCSRTRVKRIYIWRTNCIQKKHKAFVPVRKKENCLVKTISQEYDLEHGAAIIELHKDMLFCQDKRL